ncbi:hypothetical protein NEF87_001426 [Candidatus Lokiarchaeum ossiferum]|uniref:ABC3 transporter permease C-terminal domain-containing protein n=1 Tax=Candidatus Lokiarchaeum ossiferum TaxID=2951803 RepID=A0ABY6HNZ3_9ARCH|nr:hypothetical protein NEF87_001426 [Candidatus Lokiarchaeum sp. B-35]
MTVFFSLYLRYCMKKKNYSKIKQYYIKLSEIILVKYWLFYWNESISSIKKNWILLLCMALSISMFSGLSYFNESNQSNNFLNSLIYVNDIEIVHDQSFNPDNGWTTRVNFVEYFSETDTQVFKAYNESSLELTNIMKYGMMRMDEGNIVSPQWNIIDPSEYSDGFKYRKDVNATEINIGLFDANFYNSERFDQYFKILDGNVPTTNDEILVDYSFAHTYSVKIGETINITTLIGRTMNMYPLIYNMHEVLIANQTISGIYLPTQYEYDLDLNHFRYSYNYQDWVENRTYSQPLDFIESPMIFTYNDFSVNQSNHVIKKLFDYIRDYHLTTNFIRSFRTFSGYAITLDRSMLEYQKIRTWRTYISAKSYDMYIDLPFQVGYIDRISNNLKELSLEYSQNRFFLQFLNYPIILFAILINQNLIEKNEFEFNQNLLHLRSKGMPIKKIMIQKGFQTIMNGLIASIIGLTAGLLTFFGYNQFLGNLYSISGDVAKIPLISTTTILESVILGLLMSIFSYYAIIRKIKKSNYSELAEIIGENQWNNSPKTTNSLTKSFKPISVFTIIQLFIGIIPIFLFILIYIHSVAQLPDSLVDVAITLTENTAFLLIYSFVGLGLLVSAFVQIFAIQNTRIYQILSQKVAHLFVKDLNPIVAENLVLNRKWGKIISYLSIFIAFLTSLNLSFYSHLNFENLLLTYSPENEIAYSFLGANLIFLKGTFSKEFASSGFFKMMYIDFITIGLFLAIELVLTIITIAQENKRESQNLIGRGIPKTKILKMLLTQIFIVFLIAIMVGILFGFLFGLGLNKITIYLLMLENQINISEIPIPIFYEFWTIAGIIFIIFMLVCILLTIHFAHQKHGENNNHPYQISPILKHQ